MQNNEVKICGGSSKICARAPLYAGTVLRYCTVNQTGSFLPYKTVNRLAANIPTIGHQPDNNLVSLNLSVWPALTITLTVKKILKNTAIITANDTFS